MSGFEFFLWWAFHSVADIYRHGFCGRQLTTVNFIKLMTSWNPNYVGVNIYKLPPCIGTHTLGLEFGSAAQLSKRPGSV